MINSNKAYKCPKCSQTSTRKYNLQVHIERKHPDLKQFNPQMSNPNEYQMFNEFPYSQTGFKNYPPTWNTTMKTLSSDFSPLSDFSSYPLSSFYDEQEKAEQNKSRKLEREYKSTQLEYFLKIIIPSLKLQKRKFNNPYGISNIPLFNHSINLPKAYKIHKCNICFIQTLESFFSFHEIHPANKIIHNCYIRDNHHHQPQQQQHTDNDAQIKTLRLHELLLSSIDYGLQSNNKKLKVIVFPNDLIKNALSLKILILLMDIIGSERGPLRWLIDLVENDRFVDLGEIGSEHWIRRAYNCYSMKEKVTILKNEELKEFISISEGTFGLIKFRLDKKLIFTFSYLQLNSETTKQDSYLESISYLFSQFAEREIVEENQTEPVTKCITKIGEQQVAVITEDTNQSIDEYIQQFWREIVYNND